MYLFNDALKTFNGYTEVLEYSGPVPIASDI